MKIDDIKYQSRQDSLYRVDRPGGTGSWLLLMMKSPAIFRLEQVEVAIAPNSFVLFEPDYPVIYHANGPMYIEDRLQFHPDAEELKIIRSLRLPLNRVTEVGALTELTELFSAICREFYSTNTHRLKTIDLLFRMMLYKLNEYTIFSSAPTRLPSASDFEPLLALRNRIYEHPEQDWLVDRIAEELSMSRSWLQHVYFKVFGTNVMQDIITSRLCSACDQLVNTRLPAAKITENCGYSTPSYFLRQFKLRFGMTPKQYRRQNTQAVPGLRPTSAFRPKFLDVRDETGENITAPLPADHADDTDEDELS